jgi:hypothetical protein
MSSKAANIFTVRRLSTAEFKQQIFELAEDSTVDQRKIQALITSYFKNKAIPYIESFQMFVVRCGINDPGEVYRNIERCSYCPDKYKDRLGLQRATYEEQQAFYCSLPTDSDYASSSSTCITETAWEHIRDLSADRSYCTLSRWGNKRPLKLWVLPFSDESCRRNRDFERLRGDFLPLVSKYAQDEPGSAEALEFISDAFCERENKKVWYRVTAGFYNALLFFEKITGRVLDGLMYPSANTDKAGINLVLKKELVDNGLLSLEVAMMYSIQRHRNYPKQLTIGPASSEAYPEKDGTLRFPVIY